ncbi:transcription antiterminator [Sebaldella sp. S0638]|uniref:BglG family transcription antiterminator n=1 Tax=Sebaldella sp. S0638 TaxID=2957809 RepID=UPI00209D423D|nr:PTS sugar transporter subunit IIA [Sebaldella sp. S0638]MCP1223162.1 PTS sugar transporter subunit IIA [Sebaldella sp. S0638]
MLIDKKDIGILEFFLNENSVSVKKLEDDINVTERAIRTRLENLNYVFHKSNMKAELKIEKNMAVLSRKNENLRKFLEEFDLGNYNFNKYERMEIIYFFSLISEEGFKFGTLEKILNVGKSTLKNDMKEVREELHKLGFSFISKPKKGLILVGNENNIRKLLLEYILKYFYIKNFDSIEIREQTEPVARTVNVLVKQLKTEDIKLYFNFLKKIEEKMKKMISDEGFEVLIIYLMIIHSRNTEDRLLEEHISNENFLRATNEYKVLNKLIQDWKYQYNRFSSNEFEILKFVEYLLGTHSYNFDYSFYENWIQIETLIREIIKNVDEKLDISIVNDNLLEEGLINHIRPTIYRIKNNIRLKKLDLNEVTERYSVLLNIVRESVKPLEDYLGKSMEIEELVYLTIYFKLAVDRKKKKLARHINNILIVCNFGYGTSRLLVENLKERYLLNITDVIPYNNFLDYDLKDTDIIISTIDINLKHSEIPVIKVSPILDSDDEKKIKKYLKEKTYESVSMGKVMEIIEKYGRIENRNAMEKELELYLNVNREEEKEYIKTLPEILPAENMKITGEVKNWQEGIRESGKILLENGYIKESYIEECVEIIYEKGMYMLIGKNIILPHGSIKKNVFKTGMSFLKLKKEIEFPENIKIKNIVMLATLDKKEHINAFLQLKKIIDETKFLDDIEKITDERKLYDLMTAKFEKIKDKNFEILKYK